MPEQPGLDLRAMREDAEAVLLPRAHVLPPGNKAQIRIQYFARHVLALIDALENRSAPALGFVEMVCPDCRVERADYEGPGGKWLHRCPNCGSEADPVAGNLTEAGRDHLAKMLPGWVLVREGEMEGLREGLRWALGGWRASDVETDREEYARLCTLARAHRLVLDEDGGG